MIMLFSILLQTASENTSGGLSNFLPIILIIIVIYFFMIRPQITRQRKEEAFQNDLKKGDKVITIGGIHGKISGIKETTIILEINDTTKIIVEKHAVSQQKSTQNTQKK